MSAPEASRLNRKSRAWVYPLAIFAAALLLRLLYLWDISDNPFFKDLIIDLKSYDSWAQEIASGEWIGGKVFYQSPLYPYFLALIYSVFGRNLVLIYFIQAVMGALDCVVIYAVGRESFGRRAGIIAGFGAAMYKMFIFYQVLILKTFLGVILIDLAIWLTLLSRRRLSVPVSIAAGLCLGLAALARDNFLALVPFFALWLFFSARNAGISSGLRLAMFWLLGAFLALTPCLARNLLVGHDRVITTSQGGQNFYIGNHLDNYWGTYQAPEFVRANPEFEEKDFAAEAIKRTGRIDMKPSELSRFWYGQAFKEIKRDPGLFAVRLVRKSAIFLNSEEVPDNLNYQLYRERFSLLLKFPLINFAILAPLGLLGLALGLRDRKGLLLALYFAIYSATVILFYIFGRYRLAIAGPLLAFAGYALLETWEAMRSKAYKKLASYLLILLIFIGITELPIHRSSLSGALYNLGNSYARNGKWVKAHEAYQEALQEDPENIHILINYGISLLELGDAHKAIQVFEKAIELDKDYIPARSNLAKALYRSGDIPKAREHFLGVLEKDAGNIDALYYLSDIAIKTGDIATAEIYIERILDLEPENKQALELLELLKKR